MQCLSAPTVIQVLSMTRPNVRNVRDRLVGHAVGGKQVNSLFWDSLHNQPPMHQASLWILSTMSVWWRQRILRDFTALALPVAAGCRIQLRLAITDCRLNASCGNAGKPTGSRRGRKACRTRCRARGRRGRSGAACRRTRAARDLDRAQPRKAAAQPS